MFIEDVPKSQSRLFSVIHNRLIALQKDENFSYLYQVPYTDVAFYIPKTGLFFIENPQLLAALYPKMLTDYVKDKIRLEVLDSHFDLETNNEGDSATLQVTGSFFRENDQFILFLNFILNSCMRAWVNGAKIFFYRILTYDRLFYVSFSLNSSLYYYSSMPIILPDSGFFSFSVSDTQVQGKVDPNSSLQLFTDFLIKSMKEAIKLPRKEILKRFVSYS